MTSQIIINLLVLYGLFLIVCGILSVIFIGPKAKTALVSGGMSGTVALTFSFLVFHGHTIAKYFGMGLSLALFIVFSWRATKTLFAIFEMVPLGHIDLKSKGIAFLIISLMAVVSLVIFILLVTFCSAGTI